RRQRRAVLPVGSTHRPGPGGDQPVRGQGHRRARRPALRADRRALRRRARPRARPARRDLPGRRAGRRPRALGRQPAAQQTAGAQGLQGAVAGGRRWRLRRRASPDHRTGPCPPAHQPGRPGGSERLPGETHPRLAGEPAMNRSIDTLLVANRGEIACRVMRTAKALGLTTVAVHSAVDASARHAREADIRIDLGGAKPADSYLRIDKLIDAAKASGAQAIHPGYGFLSENAEFARAIEQAGLIFLGPPASAIDAMGSKSAAKALMEAAGVPLVPGYHGEAQ